MAADATLLPLPAPGREAAERWVAEHLGHLTLEGPGGVAASPRFRGGQRAADAALAAWSVDGYARRRSGVWPPSRRGASGLSPYIRHGLLPLPRMWRAVADGPAADVRKFRDELLWQEYARHVYARLGAATAAPLRRAPSLGDPGAWPEPWPTEMACMEAVVSELHRDGWAVNQTRMWLASQWTVRAGRAWQEGDDELFRHLLDGSRAANRLGWQWTVGAGTGKPYGFSQWQVEKRAPSLCKRCALREACPIQDWPEAAPGERVVGDPRLRGDAELARTCGPTEPSSEWCAAGDAREPEAVWLTAESLGDADPALVAHPELPAVFVFDEALLAGWRLSGKRLVFLAETLADLATRRPLVLHLGAPARVLAGRAVATTFAPVPGWRRRAEAIGPVLVHPWAWLARPRAGTLASYSAWRKQLGR